MPVFNNALAGAAGQTGGAAADYVIPKSLRFNSGDSAYLSKTFASAGNRKTFTFSCWVKRAKLGVRQFIFEAGSADTATDRFMIRFQADDTLMVTVGQATNRQTSQVFSDVGSWANLIVAVDTTASTANDRIKIYWNGSQITEFSSTSNPSQNADTAVNSAAAHSIGKTHLDNSNYFDGELADIQLVDGQALAPTDFGKTRSSDGVWVPKEYSGTYGTNGFHLNFSDSSTNEALGFDSAPTIPDLDPKKGMDIVTWTGNSTAGKNIGGLGFEPDLVWIKRRNASYGHVISDSVRGFGSTGWAKQLIVNSTAAENSGAVNTIRSFDPGGFTLGTDGGVNYNNSTYVGWCWRAGGPAVTNTAGDITSQVSANNDYGFSIVKWTNNGSNTPSDHQVGHGLNGTPDLVIVKSTGTTSDWAVYSERFSNPVRDELYLNNTNAKATAGVDLYYRDSTTVGFRGSSIGSSGNGQIAYCWKEVSGFSKIGTWTGTGSASGNKITTGFKPRFLMWKRTDTSDNWAMVDSERSTSDPRNGWLGPFSSDAESSNAAYAVDFLEDGFELKATHVATNASGGNYLYMCFADRPGNSWDVNNIVTNEGLSTNKDNFDVVTYTGNGGVQSIGGPVYSDTSTVSSPTNVFNNNTGNGGVFNNAENRVLTAASITINSSLEIYHNRTGSDGITVNINGTDYTATGLSNTGYHTIPIPNSSLPLTTTGNITIKDNVSNAQSTVYAVRVDGNVLVDGTGVPLKFKPDFVWIKERGGTKDHNVYDVIRGATKELFTNGTGTENTLSNGLTSFDSTGFTFGSGTRANGNNQSYVAWCLKAGGTAVSNTDGSITSSVSANPNNGFSIVTASPSNNAVSIGHGLSTAPRMIISKSRTVSYDWNVYHASLGGDELLRLNTTAAKQTVSNYFNSINSSTFSVTSGNNANNSGDMVYYCFADVPGYQKVGSWIGNGSSTGPVVVTGFRPRFLLFKRTDGTANWYIYDTERQAGNPVNKVIPPNTSGAEYTMTSMNIDFLDNGFQLKGTDGDMNNNNSVYIYLAIGDDEIGSDEDCLVDVPNAVTADADATDTTGGYQRGNYATINPLLKPDTQSVTLSNGNLKFVSGAASGNYATRFATIGMTTGKWYAEFKVNATANGVFIGIASDPNSVSNFIGSTASSAGYLNDGRKANSNSLPSYADSYGAGDIIGIAFNADAGSLAFYQNGVSQGEAYSGLTSGPYFMGISGTTNVDVDCNFGQQRFKYPIPSGYAALNTTALPPATIGKGSNHFETVLYDGTGAAQTISGLNLSPDMAWIKERNGTSWHRIVDAIRGQKEIFPNANNGESSFSQGLNSFNSDGFTLGTGSDSNVNTNNNTYVAWLWDAGSTTDTNNTDGDITPTGVRANQAAGFSIVKFTGPSSAGFQSVGHGLNAKPELIICKDLDNARNWSVYHKDSQVSDVRVVPLNQNVAAFNSGTATWDISEISNTTFTPYFRDDYGASYNADNIAYCFAPVSGFSAFGKFEGNGSNDGPFVYTGFAPAFVMFRRYDAEGYWIIFDNKRNTHKGNYREKVLYANTTDDEENSANGDTMLFLSNGFKLNNVTYAYWNANGGDYLWAAFAENPFQANGGLAR